ncbi:hypothetical protein NLU13_5386 [Sarocladium strictum]|uniref:Uncharacterized protein n=1 Tax=Sarocladium strictum TaxID=5046 RepID=A0AA39GI35_SARSR|nr:hypothetical protein NLU13_5386 [Sarocladium strictum]
MSDFTLSAQPNTDIWKKPPTTDVFNAPFRPHSKGPLTTFQSASLTFFAPYTTQYDQAGLLLTLTSPSTSAKKWIKTGIEFYNSQPRISTVCCDSWADWSVASLPPSAPAQEIQAGTKGVTIRVDRGQDENGVGFWVYYVPEGANKEEELPLREICWVFGDNGGEGWELEVSAAVARPNKDVKGELQAKFSNFNVNWSS